VSCGIHKYSCYQDFVGVSGTVCDNLLIFGGKTAVTDYFLQAVCMGQAAH